MPATLVRTRSRLHPLHGLMLAFPIALFATALANDIAYLKTAEMQWSNFAAWAITGALVFGAPVVILAAWRAIRPRTPAVRGRATIYLVLVSVMWLAGLVNAFQHSRDAWSSVGTAGLLLSILATVCALVAGWMTYSAGSIEVGATEGDVR